jgi:glycosyltransferase involved in cell wall biosynthesis
MSICEQISSTLLVVGTEVKKTKCELSVVLPCLNESETLAACIYQIQRAFDEHFIVGEIVVADNGSTDSSVQIAADLGVRVVHVAERGYGAALIGGINACMGKYVIMGDADQSYNFGDIPKLLEQMRSGAELVMGNRFRGGIMRGAMPPLHRYLGNPVLTGIGRLFFKSHCGDFHCGLRGFSKAAYERMGLRATGMEFASEMVVKAALLRMKVTEVPTTLSPDGRSRPPHLRSWRDGWRHLRFLLLYSPRWLFLYPGAILVLVGALSSALLLPGPKVIGRLAFDIHTLLYSVTAIVIGLQAVIFALFTKIFAVTEGFLPEDQRFDKMFRIFTLERGLAIGGVLTVIGLAVAGHSVVMWDMRRFGQLQPETMVRIVSMAIMFTVIGVQIIFASFFLSILGLKRK